MVSNCRLWLAARLSCGWAGFHGPWFLLPSCRDEGSGLAGCECLQPGDGVGDLGYPWPPGGEAQAEPTAAADDPAGLPIAAAATGVWVPSGGRGRSARAWRSRPGVRRPGRRSGTRSGSGHIRAAAGTAGRCLWRSGSGPRTGHGAGGVVRGRRAARSGQRWRTR